MTAARYAKIGKVSLREPLSERVYQELKRCILEGVFPPGDLLPEDSLTQATGASRTPVREALMRLQGDGLVHIAPRKGARVVALDADELHDLVEAREMFETVFFGRAARNIPRDEFEAIQARMRSAKAAIDAARSDSADWRRKRSAYLDIDFSFHRRLVEATANRLWLTYYDGLLDRLKLYSHQTVLKYPAFLEQAMEEHDLLLDALIRGDFPAAKRFLRTHIRGYRRRLTGREAPPSK